MKSKQYTIGEFATINKVSTRMLRHYDKIALLRPVSIQQNGYRCYSEEQIELISQIKQLRSCGFLLDEIGGILKNNSPKFLEEEAIRKLKELENQAVQQQNMIYSLNKLVEDKNSSISKNIYGISKSERDKTYLLSLRRLVNFDDVESAFDELFELLHQKKIQIAGCAVLMNHSDCQNEAQNRVCVPVMEQYSDVNCDTIEFQPKSMLSVIHYGDYYNIGYAYSALLSYAEQNGYPIDDIFMERYFIDSFYNIPPNEYVTEISVTLKNTP